MSHLRTCIHICRDCAIYVWIGIISRLRLQVADVRDAGVLLEPEAAQLSEVAQPADLAQVGDLVLADVELLKVLAVLDVRQRRDAVHAERGEYYVC